MTNDVQVVSESHYCCHLKLNHIFLSFPFKPEVQVRQVAVKFASTVFPPDHIPSRYLLLLAAGDP